ncbi:MAG: hypothetical protein NC395_04910 [Prevotella sp.]|nr:hypothetical protein [Prevotella sp.]
MKKFFAACIAAAAVSVLSFNVYADGSSVCIRSADTPKSADEYALDQFEQQSEDGLVILGLTSAEAQNAALGAGFRVKNPDGSTRDDLCYYPIMSGGQPKLMLSVSLYDGKYGCSIGASGLAENLFKLETSPGNPMDIYASDNGFYFLTDNGEFFFSEGYPYSEAAARKELEEIKKLRGGNASSVGTVVCYGDFDTGLVNSGGKIFFINGGGTAATGWKTVDGKKYYFRKNGEALTKSASINGVRYKFGKDGVCAGTYTGWVKSGGKRFHYLDGVKQTGWCKLSDGWHYFDETSGAHTTGSAELYGKTYTFSESGVWDGHADVDYSSPYFSLEKKLPKDASGGVYADGGVLVVMTKDREKTAPIVEKMRKTYAPIVMRDCKFSSDELAEVYGNLSENHRQYSINGWGTSVMSNRVDVTAERITDELRDYINSLDDPDIISVEIGVAVVDDDGAETDTMDCF